MIERVVIVNDMSRALGGATSLALLSARLLRARGIPVTFVSGDAGEGRAELEAIGAEFLTIGSAPLLDRGRLHAATAGLYNPAAFRALRRWIDAKDGPGVVYHLHAWSRILSPAVFHALRPVAARTLFHAHDYFLACPNGQKFDFRHKALCTRVPLSASCLGANCDKRSYAQKLWRCLRGGVRRAVFDASAMPGEVLMIHPRMRPQMEEAGFRPDALHTLRNPAEPFTRAPLSPERRRRFFMIARLDPEKGFADAAAAARLAGVPLTIIGDGPGRALLSAHHREVELLGWRTKAEIGALLAEARAVVMPTRGPEPFGLVAAEAAGSGLPLILNDQANIAPEAVAAGFGLSFATGSVPALAEAMRRLADDGLVAAMAARARSHGGRLAHDPQAWCDRLVERYEAALRRSRAAPAAGCLQEELAS